MAFNYDPKDAQRSLISDGQYDAQIVDIEETTSKAGNDMLKLTVKVWAGGDTHQITDYIVNPSSLWKLKQIAEALGMGEAFRSKKMNPMDIGGKNLLVFIKTRKDTTGKYDDQNVITKYSKDEKVTNPDDPF